jgi:hypothetical protein
MGDIIERYLRELRRQLPRGVEEGDEIVLEARDHLLEVAACLEAAGLAPDEAERRAVRRFGDAREIARQYPAAPARLRLRRAYLYGALFVATAVLSFGVSAIIAEPLGMALGEPPASSLPVDPFLHATLITGVAAAFLSLHWALRGRIAQVRHLDPPRALLLLGAAIFFLRGAVPLLVQASDHNVRVGPYAGAGFVVASWLTSWAIAAVFAAWFARARPDGVRFAA